MINIISDKHNIISDKVIINIISDKVIILIKKVRKRALVTASSRIATTLLTEDHTLHS